MATNGYSSLSAGPEAGWLGFYSLDKQGRMDGVSLDSLIALMLTPVWSGLIQRSVEVVVNIPNTVINIIRLTPTSVDTRDISSPPLG